MNNTTLSPLNAATVSKPDLPVRILQFGEGNFLRAFTDWMIQHANDAGIMHHGVAVVQPIGGSDSIRQLFEQQDCLYHVYLEGIKDRQPIKEISLVRCINQIINPYTDFATYESVCLLDSLEMIISNTTEAGIRYVEGEDIMASPPASFPGKITALLFKRWQHFNGDPTKALAIICCELIENNGSTLRQYVLKHAMANHLPADFLSWVENECKFYDTLVDRIVPGFPKENIAAIQQELGYSDNLVVKGEYFHVWAIGGDMSLQQKLPLDQAGLNVIFMDDIRDFRAKKVRILNGAHTAMVPVAMQLGCTTVREAFDLPQVEQFVNRLVADEVLPVMDGNPEELQEFAGKILERFYNPFLKHYLKDISLNSLSKWETRNFPTVADNYRLLGKKASLNAYSLAALLVLYSGQSAINFEPADNPTHVGFIRETFSAEDVKGWITKVLSNTAIWKEDLTNIPYLMAEVAHHAEAILERGMAASLEGVLSTMKKEEYVADSTESAS